MRSTANARSRMLARSVAALLALSLALAAAAGAVVNREAPRATTGGASHVLGTSALLEGSIEPDGRETTYFFKYGTTEAYGQVTPTANAGAAKSPTRVKVGAQLSHLNPGTMYHFRLVAMNSAGAVQGRDRVFTAKGAALAFSVKKSAQDTYGVPFIFSGTLTGLNSANHRIALEASPFPFLESFAIIGFPGVTNGVGAFSFRVANLLTSTQFRVITLDALPVFSPIVTVAVVPRVVLHVRSSSQRGVLRLFGTITPAVNGARVSFQVQKAVRPGRSELAVKWVNEFATVAKKAGASSSRFSIVETIRHGGRYRAYVNLPTHSRFGSGPSQATVILHAAPASALRKARK
jgi:hypothetical protein